MKAKCPECHSENPDTKQFCGDCGTQLISTSKTKPSFTKTLDAPSQQLTRGSLFAGRYEIIEELGKGGMGRVNKVLDTQINEEMALKLLKPEIALDEEMIERFRNELKIARKITHKNVCRMHDINKEGDTPYITMEYMAGEDLKSVIKNEGALNEEEAIFIAKQVCDGLAEAHELGVIHRDLKPQNIMIDEKGRARILDFGIARSIEAKGVTQTGAIIGTPDYLSPEQAAGEEADLRSDIYSLGVILYEMATGLVPFRGDTALSVALKHKTQLPQDPRKLNSNISENLSRLILICMEKDKSRRYQSAKDLSVDLKNLEEGFPLGTKIRPRHETLVSTLIRTKLLVPPILTVLVIFAVAIWQLLLKREAVSLAGSGKPSLAVVYFENHTGDSNLDYWRKALSELFIADLSQSKYLDVLPGDRLFKILEDLDQLEATSYSSDILKEVAERGRMQNILRGSYTKAGDFYRINVMLQNADTGNSIGSEIAEGRGVESLFAMVDELTRQIKANFNLSAKEIAGDIDREVGKITTSSPEAYKHFMEALKQNFNGNWKETIQSCEKAIAIDPDFAEAFTTMGWAYDDLGYRVESQKNLKRALELSDRVSDREKYRIQGALYMSSEETHAQAIEAFNKLLELYPEDITGRGQLAVVYLETEEWDKAIDLLELNMQNDIVDYVNFVNLSATYRAVGLYQKAREVLDSALERIPEAPTFQGFLAANYLCEGKYDIALAEADEAFFYGDANYNIPWVRGDTYHCLEDFIRSEEEYKKLLKIENRIINVAGMWQLGALKLFQGNLEDSKSWFRQGIERAKELGEKWWEGRHHYRLAYVHLISGDYDEALKECDLAWDGAAQVDNSTWRRSALHLKALIFLEKKSGAELQEATKELKELIDRGTNKKSIRYYFHLLGKIELEKANYSKAIDHFKDAVELLPYQKHWYWYYPEDHVLFHAPLARAYYESGNIENAMAEYKRIISLTTGRLWHGDLVAKNYYMLGKIFEEKGWKGKAMENYERFLNLWKDADFSVNEINDARERLAGLKSQ